MRNFDRPNILLLYTDQQRLDTIAACGGKYAVSPGLDRLCAQGVRFSNFYVQNPVCMPSRMSFLTGRYCSSLGIGCNGIPFPASAHSLNMLLSSYGYETAQIGKLHFQPHALRDHRNPHPVYGFDTFILSDEPGCYDDAYTKWVEAVASEEVKGIRTSLPPAALFYGKTSYSDVPRNTHEPYIFESSEDLTHSSFVAAETIRFLKKPHSGPFFAIAGFYAPHTPVNPPRRYVEMFNEKDMGFP
ncbi:MAG TPA: hypothetical protein DC049_00670, partial [Spirochaetia bacterium]|nr:hypothetical protein [Spirochaetia bacterium]